MTAFLKPGDRLDSYRIDEIAARNEVATIFRATDLRHNRPMALRVPHPHLEGDPTFADWLRREEKAASLLNHPGVMKVIADDERTQTYIVMEWFEGKPLRQILIKEKRITSERAAQNAVAICDALEHIHGCGIVLGSLRPENVLVGAADSIIDDRII